METFHLEVGGLRATILPEQDERREERVDSIQVLPWGNTLLIRPTCTVGLPVSTQKDKSSFSSGMFWRAAMSPGETRGGGA